MPLLNRFIKSPTLVKYHSMRLYPIFLFLLALLPASADAGDGLLDTASRFARSGAPHLALARVERDQPTQADTPQWLQWEALRLSLLAELNRDQEALQRASQLPPEIPAESRTLYLSAALAAQHLNDPPLTREYLAKWLWLGEPDDNQKKEARRMAIQSYLAQHRTDTAYLAMLRYQQDYQPLSATEVTQFVEQLLLAGGVAEAGNWLAQLDDASPLKLLLRLKAGLISPEAAIAAARAALNPLPLPQPQTPPTPAPPPQPASAKSKANKKAVVVKKAFKMAPALQPKLAEKDIAAYWSIIAQAAELQKNPALQAEALERQLNLPASQEDGLFGVTGESLRRAYAELALNIANQAQLLVGDDAAWFELATHAPSPLAARALFSSLSPQNASLELRISAETNLAAQLLDNKLDVAAMRLFAADAHFPAANHALLAVFGGNRHAQPVLPAGREILARRGYAANRHAARRMATQARAGLCAGRYGGRSGRHGATHLCGRAAARPKSHGGHTAHCL
ncbi:MAG: hypothetical protein WC091_10205 [Sulfuricellaceae bacterium]